MNLHSRAVLVFLYILIFAGCSVSSEPLNEGEVIETSKTDATQKNFGFINHDRVQTQALEKISYKSITSEALLKQILPLVTEVRAALADSDKIEELEFKSSIQALSYDRELLDILRDLNLVQKMLLSLKSDTELELKQIIKNNYPIPKLSFKLSTMEKIALENRVEILENNYKERISKKAKDPAGIAFEKERKKNLYLYVITQVHLALDQYKQSVDAYKLSKEYLDISEEICEQTIIANTPNTKNRFIVIKEKFNYLLAILRHALAYADMQKSYAQTYASLGILKDSDVSYEKDRPVTQEVDFKLQLQIQKNKRIQRDKRLANIQKLEKINEIRKQKQFLIIKEQEEKRRLQRVAKRNEKRRLEISKKLQTQRKADIREKGIQEFKEQKLLEAIARIEQKKHLYQMRKIDKIDSLEGIREMVEEIKTEIAQLK